MRQGIYKFVIVILIVVLTGCTDRIEIEDATLILSLGLDLDEKNNLVVYERSPIFRRGTHGKTDHTGVHAATVQRSYSNFEALISTSIYNGKTQLLFIGKRLLQRKEIFPFLDSLNRDPENATNLRVIAVDGPVSEVINMEPKDKPRLSIYIAQLVDTSALRHLTTKVTLRQFHYMIVEPGITPIISEIRKDQKELRILGNALLDKKGYYCTSLNLRETQLLELLRDTQRTPYEFTFPVRLPGNHSKNKKNISISIKPKKLKITTNYHNGVPQFDIDIKLVGNITERTFNMNLDKEANKRIIETIVEEEMNKQMATLIKKLQRYQVDPIGLGLYVRAYHYNEWKAIEKEWPKTFAKSTIRFTPHVEIKNIGVLH
ncbi:Ger(x)C family spore germination protein [Brevibacillus daliensis]|uniref:Ger(x)C family spore germination protein n=1 Tax=Brevibacillus daliensis TaxID=2892995 RepID=UPI001E6089B3|nr:Ger(x)C family spore germination protein [Brevibacillus daliensis]